jgi:hypothetical protein
LELKLGSKAFSVGSAHVSGSSEYDVGGWDVYGEDWRYFYECMLAPTPVQVTAYDKE